MPIAKEQLTFSTHFSAAEIAAAKAAAPVVSGDESRIDRIQGVVTPGGGVSKTITSRRRTRGPNKKPAKEQVAIRLDQEVVGALRASGPGWQTRVNAALKEWLTFQPAKRKSRRQCAILACAPDDIALPAAQVIGDVAAVDFLDRAEVYFGDPGRRATRCREWIARDAMWQGARCFTQTVFGCGRRQAHRVDAAAGERGAPAAGVAPLAGAAGQVLLVRLRLQCWLTPTSPTPPANCAQPGLAGVLSVAVEHDLDGSLTAPGLALHGQ